MSATAPSVAVAQMLWRDQPYAGTHRCGECGELTYCHGTRRNMRCFDCFAGDRYGYVPMAPAAEPKAAA